MIKTRRRRRRDHACTSLKLLPFLPLFCLAQTGDTTEAESPIHGLSIICRAFRCCRSFGWRLAFHTSPTPVESRPRNELNNFPPSSTALKSFSSSRVLPSCGVRSPALSSGWQPVVKKLERSPATAKPLVPWRHKET